MALCILDDEEPPEQETHVTGVQLSDTVNPKKVYKSSGRKANGIVYKLHCSFEPIYFPRSLP